MAGFLDDKSTLDAILRVVLERVGGASQLNVSLNICIAFNKLYISDPRGYGFEGGRGLKEDDHTPPPPGWVWSSRHSNAGLCRLGHSVHIRIGRD